MSVVCMYSIFIILFKNYEKAAHALNSGSSASDCVFIILFQFYESRAGLFEYDLF